MTTLATRPGRRASDLRFLFHPPSNRIADLPLCLRLLLVAVCPIGLLGWGSPQLNEGRVPDPLGSPLSISIPALFMNSQVDDKVGG